VRSTTTVTAMSVTLPRRLGDLQATVLSRASLMLVDSANYMPMCGTTHPGTPLRCLLRDRSLGEQLPERNPYNLGQDRPQTTHFIASCCGMPLASTESRGIYHAPGSSIHLSNSSYGRSVVSDGPGASRSHTARSHTRKFCCRDKPHLAVPGRSRRQAAGTTASQRNLRDALAFSGATTARRHSQGYSHSRRGG
jgi:hypothetical protein